MHSLEKRAFTWERIDGKDGLIWITLGVFLCIGSIKLNLGSFRIPGPGFLPFLSGTSLALLGLILMLTRNLTGSRVGNKAGNEVDLVNWNLKDFLIPFLSLLVLCLYALMLEPIGFLLTSFVCLLILFKLPEPKKWIMPIAYSFSVTALTYLLFFVWLKCQFPRGVFSWL